MKGFFKIWFHCCKSVHRNFLYLALNALYISRWPKTTCHSFLALNSRLSVVFIKRLLSFPLLIPVSVHCTGNESLFTEEEGTWAGEAAPFHKYSIRRFFCQSSCWPLSISRSMKQLMSVDQGSLILWLYYALQSQCWQEKHLQGKVIWFHLQCVGVPLPPCTSLLVCTGEEEICHTGFTSPTPRKPRDILLLLRLKMLAVLNRQK